MESGISIGILATIFLISGVAFATDQNTASSDRRNMPEGVSSKSTNKVVDQDLSDKAMKESQSGADTKIIQMGFKRLDSNDDGSISSEEASMQPPLNIQFMTVDKDGNGKIDMNEFARFAEANGDSIQNDRNISPNKDNTSSGTAGP